MSTVNIFLVYKKVILYSLVYSLMYLNNSGTGRVTYKYENFVPNNPRKTFFLLLLYFFVRFRRNFSRDSYLVIISLELQFKGII